MARSDLLINLVKAGSRGDHSLFQRTVDAIIAEERGKQHNVLALQLEKAFTKNGESTPHVPQSVNGFHSALFHEQIPGRSIDDLILASPTSAACLELIEEQHRADILRSHSLEPRNRVLLIGPPGNGKTCLAEAIAKGLGVSLLSVRYESLVGSYLGETATRLQKLFDYAVNRPCVLFFDEFDTLGKERGDVHDTGEIKRVVSSLLLQIDRLPSYVVVVAATNHQELLDRAVWRRFQLRLELPRPTPTQTAKWMQMAKAKWKFPSGVSAKSIAEQLKFESFAELEEFVLDVIRRMVLAHDNKEAAMILKSRISQWKARSRARTK